MTSPTRNALAELSPAAQALLDEYSAAADFTFDPSIDFWDVCPAELVRRLMEAMAASAALLAQPEPPELTDEVLTMTYAYAVAAAVGNRRGPYKLEDAEAAQLAGLRAAIAADRARRIP